MVSSIIYETNFWLTINIILAIVIIGLVYKQYTSMRQSSSSRQKVVEQDNRLEPVMDRFKTLRSQGKFGEAIVETYGMLFGKVVNMNGMSQLTFGEILSSNRLQLGDDILNHLKMMYGIYERVRYGSHNPTEEELNMFHSSLEVLNAHWKVWKSVVSTV